jgi:hypothetical protein
LIWDPDIDVLEMDRVAEILGGTIELIRHGCGSGYYEGQIIL